MRSVLALCIGVLVAGGIVIWQAVRWPKTFGTFSGAADTEVAALVDNPTGYLGKTVAVAGTVRKQCRTMGCFFFFDSGKRRLRIDLKDIAINAPKKEGHLARVEGQLMPYTDGYQLLASAVEF